MIRYIYTFFVGLFLAIFVGMGISLFYVEPKPPEAPAWYGVTAEKDLTSTQQQEEIAFNNKQKTYNQQMYHYNRNASLIALVCAVIILVISLSFAEKIGVIADGLLLGGIFTLLYGVGRGMATNSNAYRFLVASVGLIVTIILGYLKLAAHKLDTERKAGSL